MQPSPTPELNRHGRGTGRWNSLDIVLELNPGHGARAVRNISNTLSILSTHFPRFPVFPGVLILGSLGELAELLLLEQTGRPWHVVRFEHMRFRKYVRPGDQLELVVELKTCESDSATVSASARVDGAAATTVRLVRLVPLV